jgi:hypothetical protein
MVWLSRERDGKEDTNQAAGLAWLDDGLRVLAVARVWRCASDGSGRPACDGFNRCRGRWPDAAIPRRRALLRSAR